MKFVLPLLILVVVVLGFAPLWAYAQFFSGSQYWAAIIIHYALASAMGVKAK